jgi:hypothetical protein
MFDLSDVKENAGGGKRLYIYPGVLNVTINGWSATTNANGKELLQLEVTTVDAMSEGTQNASKKFDFYFTENAQEKSLQKVKHIVTKVTKEANIKPANDLAGFAGMLNSISKGKSLRMKFTGEQYLYNGEVKVSARIGLPAFAEATNPGAEYEPVADADTKLVYDENNKYDFKKLEGNVVVNNEVPAEAPAPVEW